MYTLESFNIKERQQLIHLSEVGSKHIADVLADFTKHMEGLETTYPGKNETYLKVLTFRHLAGVYCRSKFYPKIFANNVMLTHHFITPENSLVPHVYDDGYYSYSTKDIKLRQIVSDSLGIKSCKQNEDFVMSAIVTETAKSVDIYNPSNGWICLNNGLYNLKTGNFNKNFDPNIILFNRIPVDFVADIDTTEAKEYLDSICNEREKLEEMMGDTLNPHNYSKKVHFLHGLPNCGKTTYCNMLEKLVGLENRCCLSLEDFYTRFQNFGIYGKLLNIKSEISYKTKLTVKDAHAVKEISGGGDGIKVEEKGRQAFTYKPIAKHIFSGNDIPLFQQSAIVTKGFPERMDFTVFDVDVFKKDGTFIDSITTPEMMSQFLSLALKGNQRLRKNKYVFHGFNPIFAPIVFFRISHSLFPIG